jgi:hypothetical protein
LQTVASTSDLTKRINTIEHDSTRGPACRRYSITTVTESMTCHRTLGGRFGAAADAFGVRSMLGYALFASGRTLATLELYSSRRNESDADSEVIGELFDPHAAIALIGATRHAELHRAISSRDTIGIAKGILMHREGISANLAFNLLASASQYANMTLHDVAAWLVENTARQAD